jgi:hypothetical protein
MGVTRWWEVRHLPATGQLSNVSALVLPAPRVMDEHGQMQMFPPEDLLRLLHETAALQHQTAEIMQRLAATGGNRGTSPKLRVVRPWRPQNERFRTYRGFRDSMVELERALPREQKKNKTNVCGLGADSVKTVTRTMHHYHLGAAQWPPSSWPEQEPPVSSS